MQEWPDDQLDDFFRKSAEENDPNFDPHNWEALRKRLDEADGVKPAWWKNRAIKGLILAGLMGLVGSLVYFWKSDFSSTSPGRGNQDHGAFRAVPSKETAPQPARRESAAPPPATRVSTEKPAANPVKGLKSGKLAARAASETPVTGPPGQQASKKRSRQKDVAGGEPRNPGGGNARGTGETPFYASLTPLVPPAFRALEWGAPAVKQPENTSLPVASESDPADDEPPLSTRRWAIRIGAGPDMSAVKVPNFSPPTFAWAAHLDYRVTRHIWLQTGYVKSNKKYEALPGDYTWPKRWYQDVLPEGVDATCDMVEIPVNLKYVLERKNGSSWHFALGATNYQMRTEKYEYRYKNPDPSIRWYSWEGSTGWYWASHVHVSAGYERRLTRHLRMGIEPYIKIPTRKVGFGRVNLYTAGAWLYLSFGR